MDDLPPEESPRESDCKSESNGNTAQKASQNVTNEGGESNMSGFKRESVVALSLGFVLSLALFAFLGWLADIFEKAHVNPAIIFGVFFVMFVLGISGIAWLIIEWVGYLKSVITVCFLILVLFLVFLICHKSVYVEESGNPNPAPPQPKPQFTFELRMADANWFDRVKLTNDFLSYNIDNKVHKVLGCLFVPIQTGQSNVELTFSCENKSEIEAEDIEFAVAVPKSLKCIPDSKWSRATINDLVVSDPEQMGTNVKTDEMESFIFFAPHPLLPKDTGDLPSIKLGIYPIMATMAVIARAKECPEIVINFNLFFMTNSVFEKNDFHRPFVLLETNLDEIMNSPISPEMLKELQK